MHVVSLPVSTISGKKKLFSQEVGELSLLGLIYKKKKPRGQTEFCGLVFCRLVCLRVAATLGTASDFRAERAVCWVGGQMEGGCTTQLSSASFPLLAHILYPHFSLAPVHSFIYSANPFYALSLS